MYVLMYDYIYVLFKSFLASQVWYHAVAWARTYGTDSPQLLVSHANHSTTETSLCMYVCLYVCR